jgi:membrane-associated phospholipid phosphatase
MSLGVHYLSDVLGCIDKRYGYKLSFAFLFSGVINGVVKSIFLAKRPIGVEGIRSLRVETATGTSFPSGHTQNIASFLVSLMKKLNRAWVYITGCLLILLVGVSRLYLGLHWPLDVLGGMVLGTACVFLADFAFEYAHRKNRKLIHLLLLIPALAAAYFWRDSEDLVKTAGTFCSFLIGYSLESRFIRFEVKTAFWKQIIKFLLGMTVVLALKEGLKILLPAQPVFDFARYLVIGLWITVAAPVVFRSLGLCGVKFTQEEKAAGL